VSGAQHDAQTASVIDRGVDVAAGDRITDPEELIAAVGVANDLLWTQVKQGLLIDSASSDISCVFCNTSMYVTRSAW
jgi:hypothetical protein